MASVRTGKPKHLIWTAFALSLLVANGNVDAAVKKEKLKSKLQQKRLKINPLTDVNGAWVSNMETDIYQAGTFENITLGYSAHNDWDMSVSMLNVEVLGNNKFFQGDTFINLTKTFEINDRYSITVATQNGVALANVHPRQWFNFDFLDNRFDLMPWLSIHCGPYLANKAITGTVRQVGFLTGIEITFIEDQLSLQMDYLSGHHSLSGASANLLYNIFPHWQIYIGVLVPEQHSGNEFAGILGFNFSTHPL